MGDPQRIEAGRSVSRDDWILLVLFAGGKKQRYNEPVAGKTRLMKLLFLLGQRLPHGQDYFEFEPYKFGPNSTDVLRRLDGLMSRGYIQSEPGYGSEIYSLTPEGVKQTAGVFESLDPKMRQQTVDVKIQFNSMPLPELLALVYERFPRFAARSEYEGPPVE